MKKIILNISLILVLIIFIAACNAVHYEAKSGNVSFTPVKGKVVKSVKADGKAWTYLLRIISAHVDVSKKLGIEGDKTVANLRIEQKNSILDNLISIISFSMATPNSYEIKGDLVEAQTQENE